MATRPRSWAACKPPKNGVCSRKRVRPETSRMRGIVPICAPFARVSLYVSRMNDLTLGAAAAALDAELRRFEQIAELLSRLKLDSEKNLDRAIPATEEAAPSEEKVAAAVRDLVAAVARARERQEGQAKVVAERAREAGGRREELQTIIGRFVELGAEASAINGLLKEGGNLGEAAERMERIAGSAKALRDDAETREFGEPARQAESLRQQLLSARTKLKLVERKRGKE